MAGRVGTLDDLTTYRILTSEPALATLTGQLLGALVYQAKSGGPIAHLRPAEAAR
ncbi:hypothetical protein ABZS68_32395 [Streptomyces sp. NPDC005571]|uniref:hypothetical protein n=1 Tax=Streptomyces sp. NPDC005571 TaxID=3156888 RepID=UPI0033B23BD2